MLSLPGIFIFMAISIQCADLLPERLLVTSATHTLRGDGFIARNLTVQNTAGTVGLRALTDEEATAYTLQKVLGGSDGWDPTKIISF